MSPLPSTCLTLLLNLGLKRKPGRNPWRFTLNFAEVQNLGLLDPQVPKDGGADETAPEHDLGGPAIDVSRSCDGVTQSSPWRDT